jgi:hypothetical protein
MKLFSLLFLFCSWSWAGQNIKCFSLEGKEKLQFEFRFETEDLSKYAKFKVTGSQLFQNKKEKQDSCGGFAMRSRQYVNTINIHNNGCDVWHCTLFVPDSVHGEVLENFKALFQCYPADSHLDHWEKANVRCSSTIE